MKSLSFNQAKLKPTAQKFGLDFLVLFGSQINGLANKKSDFDIGYASSHPLDLEKEYQLTQELQKKLKNQAVDLVNVRKCSPLLAKKALLEGKLLAENTPHSFANQQIIAFHNYVETKPLRQFYARPRNH